MFDPQSCMMQDLAPCVIEFDIPGMNGPMWDKLTFVVGRNDL